MSSSAIREGEQSTTHDSDPIVRGPIPNEREIKHQKLELRKIRFSGEGSEVRQPSSLPFKPPGLQWNGAPSITTRQLLEQRKTKKTRKGQITGATSDSTTTNPENS